MSTPEGGFWPLHPDQYRRHLGLSAPEPQAWLASLTDSEMEAMWEQDQESEPRDPMAYVYVHRHGCGHECTSAACFVLAQLKEWHCEVCRRALDAAEDRAERLRDARHELRRAARPA